MSKSNSYLISKISKDENCYKYDNFGNIIADSIDDLIYDKYNIKDKHELQKGLKKRASNAHISNDLKERNKRIKEDKKHINLGLNILLNDNKSHNIISLINNNKKIDISIEDPIKEITITNHYKEKSNSLEMSKKKNNKFLNNNIKAIKLFKNKKKISSNNSKNLKDKENYKNISINKNGFKLQNKSNNKKIIIEDNNNEKRDKQIKRINTLKNNTQKKNFKISLIKSRSFNTSMNHHYNKKDINNYNKTTKSNTYKNYILKLKLNSNNSSIESISIENENNKIKKLKREYIFVKPLLSNCYISKIDKTFKNKMNLIKEVSNLIGFKRNYLYKQNKRKKKINDVVKNNSFFQNNISSPMIKYNERNINYYLSKKILSNPKKAVKDNIKNNILNNKKNSNIKNFNKYSLNIYKSKENTFNNSLLLFNQKCVSVDKPLLKIKNKNYNRINKNKKSINNKGNIKYKPQNEKFPLKLKMMNKNRNNKNKSYFNIKEDKINKKLMDYCRKEEINKLKLINNRNYLENYNIFKNYSKTSRANNTFEIQKSFSKNNKSNNKSNLIKKDLIDYFNNDKSIMSNNYNNLIKKEFPAINSYFHKINKK